MPSATTLTEPEFLVLFTVQKFRCYLCRRHFTLLTDHHSLCRLVGLHNPSTRLARWALRLQEYDFTVSHKSWRQYSVADCLSRLPLPGTSSDDDTFDDCVASVLPEFPDTRRFQEEQRKGPMLYTFFETTKGMSSTAFVVRDGMLFKKNYSANGTRLLLLVPTTLRHVILHRLHDDITSGHLGLSRTLHWLRQRFYWPGKQKAMQQCVRQLPSVSVSQALHISFSRSFEACEYSVTL